MANIIDYVAWRGDIPIAQVPVGEVDALLFSYLSYMPFDGIVEDGFVPSGVTLADAARELLRRNEEEKTGLAYSIKDDRKLLAKVAASERFGTIELCGYENQLKKVQEEQFSAITFLLEDGTAFVAYRGTDDTVVGWKEDFNMSFTDTVPSQHDAMRYAQRMHRALKRPMILGGHSKGGNLAAYAGMFVDEQTRGAIRKVYNFDGPGFNEAMIASPAFRRMDMRVSTFVPHSAMIGIMLWHNEPFTIVQSDGMGLFQHNAYTWQVMGGQFVTVAKRTSNSHFADETIKHWLSELTPDKRRQVIDGIFSVLNVSGGTRFIDLFEPKSVLLILKAAGAMDEQTRDAVMDAFRLLGNALVENMPGWIDRTANDIMQMVSGDKRAEEANAQIEGTAQEEKGA